MRTCGVSYSKAAAFGGRAITKDSEMDSLERSDGYAFDDRRADGGQEEQDERNQQCDGERSRRSQHIGAGDSTRACSLMSADGARRHSGVSVRTVDATLVTEGRRSERVTAIR